MAQGTTRRGQPGADAARPRPRRRLEGWRLALLVGLAGALPAFLGVWALMGTDGPAIEERRDALLAYLDELEPLTKEAGFVVINGLRAGVNDIPAGAFSDEILQEQPRGWQRDLRDLRARLADVSPPPGLGDAHAELLRSMDGYVEVAEQLEAAAQAPQYRRRMLSRRAANLGEDMDRVWNLGAYEIQRELVAVGEDMVIWLPDPTLNPDADDYVDGDPDEQRPNDFLRGD